MPNYTPKPASSLRPRFVVWVHYTDGRQTLYKGSGGQCMYPVFVDWLSMSQTHASGLPILNDGHVFAVDQDGQEEWTGVN